MKNRTKIIYDFIYVNVKKSDKKNFGSLIELHIFAKNSTGCQYAREWQNSSDHIQRVARKWVRIPRGTTLSTKSERSLRSANKKLLEVPKTTLKTAGDRAFASTAPKICNDLTIKLRNSESISIFKRELKTYLFRKAYMS